MQRDSDAFGGAASDLPRFLLLRAGGQPPLPAAVGKRKRQSSEEGDDECTLSLFGTLAERPACSVLPPAAEELLGTDSITVVQAIARLRAERSALVTRLQPEEAYMLARRSVLHQSRLRAALHLLHATDGHRQPTLASPHDPP